MRVKLLLTTATVALAGAGAFVLSAPSAAMNRCPEPLYQDEVEVGGRRVVVCTPLPPPPPCDPGPCEPPATARPAQR